MPFLYRMDGRNNQPVADLISESNARKLWSNINLALPKNSGKIDIFYEFEGLLDADLQIALLPLMLRKLHIAKQLGPKNSQELYAYHFVRALILYILGPSCEEAKK